MATVTQETTQTVFLTNGQQVSPQSNEAKSLDGIPTIDVSQMWSSSLEERRVVADQIRSASRKIGFFTIINHGIGPTLPQSVLAEAKAFFALPVEKKMQVSADLIPNEFCG